jgi:hypothetical protein
MYLCKSFCDSRTNRPGVRIGRVLTGTKVTQPWNEDKKMIGRVAEIRLPLTLKLVGDERQVEIGKARDSSRDKITSISSSSREEANQLEEEFDTESTLCLHFFETSVPMNLHGGPVREFWNSRPWVDANYYKKKEFPDLIVIGDSKSYQRDRTYLSNVAVVRRGRGRRSNQGQISSHDPRS